MERWTSAPMGRGGLTSGLWGPGEGRGCVRARSIREEDCPLNGIVSRDRVNFTVTHCLITSLLLSCMPICIWVCSVDVFPVLYRLFCFDLQDASKKFSRSYFDYYPAFWGYISSLLLVCEEQNIRNHGFSKFLPFLLDDGRIRIRIRMRTCD